MTALHTDLLPGLRSCALASSGAHAPGVQKSRKNGPCATIQTPAQCPVQERPKLGAVAIASVWWAQSVLSFAATAAQSWVIKRTLVVCILRCVAAALTPGPGGAASELAATLQLDTLLKVPSLVAAWG